MGLTQFQQFQPQYFSMLWMLVFMISGLEELDQ